MAHLRSALAPVVAACACLISTDPATADRPKNASLRAGIIGLDTSHVVAFTKLLNDPDKNRRVRVVAAYAGGSPDIRDSRDRIAGFTNVLRQQGIAIVDSIDELLKQVDVVLLESVDGRKHLEQARPVILAGKPLFIDKPVAGNLADAVAIYQLAKRHKVPVFSSSALRFSESFTRLKQDKRLGRVLGCSTYGPCTYERNHPDLYWYGIHGVETLFTFMGPGCQSVVRIHQKDTDVVVGAWADGRIGVFRGQRSGKTDFGVTVFGERSIRTAAGLSSYEPLVDEIARFFHTGRAPVSAEETLEIYAFMSAAQRSREQGGAAVKIADVLAAARGRRAAPSRTTDDRPDADKITTIDVAADGALRFDGKVVNRSELTTRLAGLAKDRSRRVLVRGAADTPYRHIAELLAVARKAGVTDIAVAVRRSTPAPRAVPAPRR